MKKRIKRYFLYFIILAVMLETFQLLTESTGVTSVIANTFYNNNFHTVRANKLYRSAQMSGEELKRTVKEHQIKTVIDLRFGEDDADKFNKREHDYLSEENVTYLHLPLLGSKIPEISTIEHILQTFKTAKEPILVHCSSGTHRTGVIAALWLMTQEGISVEEASKQLSSKYGFFRTERELKSYFSGRLTVDNLIWKFLDYKKSGGDLEFLDWAKKEL